MTNNVSFNALKFYDLDIYLSKLMLYSGLMNGKFQNDIQSIFINKNGIIFREGPLKKIEGCKIKTVIMNYFHNHHLYQILYDVLLHLIIYQL